MVHCIHDAKTVDVVGKPGHEFAKGNTFELRPIGPVCAPGRFENVVNI